MITLVMWGALVLGALVVVCGLLFLWWVGYAAQIIDHGTQEFTDVSER